MRHRLTQAYIEQILEGKNMLQRREVLEINHSIFKIRFEILLKLFDFAFFQIQEENGPFFDYGT